MNRSFHVVAVAPEWAALRKTHPAVASAIHAIAAAPDGPWADRTPEAIWEAPTPGEWDNVVSAVEDYIRLGDFTAEADGRYPWGEEAIKLAVPNGYTHTIAVHDSTGMLLGSVPLGGDIEAEVEEQRDLAAVEDFGEWSTYQVRLLADEPEAEQLAEDERVIFRNGQHVGYLEEGFTVAVGAR